MRLRLYKPRPIINIDLEFTDVPQREALEEDYHLMLYRFIDATLKETGGNCEINYKRTVINKKIHP